MSVSARLANQPANRVPGNGKAGTSSGTPVEQVDGNLEAAGRRAAARDWDSGLPSVTDNECPHSVFGRMNLIRPEGDVAICDARLPNDGHIHGQLHHAAAASKAMRWKGGG